LEAAGLLPFAVRSPKELHELSSMPNAPAETELAKLGFWPAEAVKRLGDSWITSPQQLVAVAATPEGISALAAQSGLPRSQLLQLLALTKAALPSDVARELSKPADTSQYGTGALAPPKQRQ
jgi:hypothetical protein